MQNSKNAFTMIELIFVIVILGILAAVAIPKLSATRNDAKVASDMMSAAQALDNLAAEFTAKGSFTAYTVSDANDVVKCFVFTLNNASDGNITVSVINPASLACPSVVQGAVRSMASRNGLISISGSPKDYLFAGTSVAD